MKKLSIFIDESGDFGEYNKVTEFYIVSFVLHDRANSITPYIDKLNNELKKTVYSKGAIHCEPLIRREGVYKDYSPNNRREVLTKLFFFSLKAPIKYQSFLFSKKIFKNPYKLQAQISRTLNDFVVKNKNFFDSFDKISIYYDNGQHELTKILNAIFALNFKNYEFKLVAPANYKLFQTANMICTLRLTNEKMKYYGLSKSEKLIFHSKSDFRKEFIKRLIKKRFC